MVLFEKLYLGWIRRNPRIHPIYVIFLKNTNWVLRVVRSFYFWNKCRKDAHPTYNDSEFKWLQSILVRYINSSLNFSVVVCLIRFFPSLISEINWLGSELPLKFSLDSTLIFVSEPTRISDMDSNTKSGEPNIPTSQENITQLCKGQCGFFGTADNQGFCSVSTLWISDES